ncbi:MAG: 2-dehydropantoate 2-reductase [Solirubrobacteraceae bacterium]
MRVAILGPGGVGGLVAGALARANTPIVIVASESTTAVISAQGIKVRSVLLGDFVAQPRAEASLQEPVDVLVVATKAAGLAEALERIEVTPPFVLPLLNGLDHLAVLRRRFGEDPVVAGTIRVEADRPEPAVVVHTSKFLRVDMASHAPAMRDPMDRLAGILSQAGVPARVYPPEPFDPSPALRPVGLADGGEAQVMWSKLVRLNALACTTSAYDRLLGEIRSTPALRADLVASIEEGCAVARAEGASIPADDPLGELTAAHATLGSSMQRDIAAGRSPELDAIPGSVLRAAARHGIACPATERLVAMIAERAGVALPVVAGPADG